MDDDEYTPTTKGAIIALVAILICALIVLSLLVLGV